MKINASCVYDYEAIKALSDVQNYKKKNPKTQKAIITVACIAGLGIPLAFGVWRLIVDGPESDTLTMMIVLAAIMGGMLWCVHALPKIAYKNSGSLAEMLNSYVFEPTQMTVTSESKTMKGESTTAYTSLFKAYETSKYMFIYINRVSAYVVDKSTMSESDMQQVKQWLTAALGKKKYIVCKY